MVVIKNFREVEATPEQIDLFATSGFIPKFLRSEDGQDWYECQSQFSDHTVKIMFDSNGIVRSVVDKPVPQRGNVLAVSMFFPINMSVAEISAPLPDGFSIWGEWVFDGESVVPRILTPEELAAVAEMKKQQLQDEADTAIARLQRAVKLNMATDEEKVRLTEWEKYSVLLSRINPEDAPKVAWPPKPE
ncbi:tail fiber assembly protein [Yokenella regensburgei]|uniref:tail fiber assembly protein n=2 Tax=Yokenella regensburgei TaxID=158877 RepID=UPI003EDA6813